MTRYGEVKQMQHFYHHGNTICHPKSGYVTTKLHGTSTCRCNNNEIFSERAILTCLTAGGQALVMHAKVAIRHGDIVDFIIIRVSNFVLPKYRVNYYDYIIKWCFGI